MKKDFLKSLGLEEDVVQKIQAEIGKDISVLKNQITELQDDLAQKDVIIQKRDGRIAELEQIDVEAVKKEEYERGKTDGLAEVEKIKFETAVNAELSGCGAKNVKALTGLLDMEKVTMKDGVLTGLSEQIEAIKQDNAYLFADEPAKPGFSAGVTGTGGTPGITKEQFEKMGYAQRLQLRKSDPEAYKELTGKGEG